MPLLTTKTLPPGGWAYAQLDASGRLFKGFRASGPFDDFCKEILNVRLGNNLPNATLDSVVADVHNSQCLRLGNDPRYCVDVNRPATAASIAASKPKGCRTCGGKRA